MAAVAVITDSTSDLDAATQSCTGIGVVPLFVHFGDTRYRDSLDLSRDAFYAKLQAEAALPTTSQPTPAMFEDAFRPHVEAGEAIVCLTIMASLSGTINAATTAAQSFPGADIRIVDSGTVSGGLYLQALHAGELARDGADADTVVAALARDRAVERGYATIPDLSHAVRTGRVSRAQAFIGSLVKIVPVLRIDGGRIEEEARVRTFARAQETMIAAAARDANAAPGARVCVIHARAAGLAAALAERLEARIVTDLHSFDLIEAGPVIGTHAGPGAAGIFVLPAA
jgi:fatty acid kinase fatty acid binding subunit